MRHHPAAQATAGADALAGALAAGDARAAAAVQGWLAGAACPARAAGALTR